MKIDNPTLESLYRIEPQSLMRILPLDYEDLLKLQ